MPYSINDICQVFKVHQNTIRNWIAKGYLSPKKRAVRGVEQYVFNQKDVAQVVEHLKERGLLRDEE